MSKRIPFLILLVLWALPALAQVGTSWVKRYDNSGIGSDIARAIAVDDSGNVYVTGTSYGLGTSYDYATIKYYPIGDIAWVKRYNGPNEFDDASAIAVDGSNNVYVTGSSGTIKYDTHGNQLWINSGVVVAMVVDDSGNVYVTGLSGTTKYDADGNQLWFDSWGGADIAVDDSGNVYVTGISKNSGTDFDYTTIKYDSSGNQLWIRIYNGPANSDDHAVAIAVDDSSNVYVTGISMGSGTESDYATVKYDANGDTGWVRRYNGPGNGDDEASAIAVDDSNNIYVTGTSCGSGTDLDYATIKYGANGDTGWVRRYNGPGNGDDEACAIAVDICGNIYVTGTSEGSGTGWDYATIGYDPDGSQLWVKRYSSPENNWYDEATSIAVDDSNNVYVTGRSRGSVTFFDYATIKYSPSLRQRGDSNDDGNIDLSDVIHIANYLLKGGPAPVPLESADVNCDTEINVGDVIYLANYLLKGGPPPC